MSELPLSVSDAYQSVPARFTGASASAHAHSSTADQGDGPPASVPAQRAHRMTDLPPAPIPDLRGLPALLTVAETAEVLRVGRTWVYEHAAELGAVKLGPGQTAPLRIPSDGVRRMMGLPPARPERRSTPAERHRERTASAAELRARPRL